MGSLYNRGEMTPIEKWQHKIELLEREQRYIEDDIKDLQEKIKDEMEADKLAEQEYMEE